MLDSAKRDDQSNLLTSTGPLIPTATFPFAVAGNPLGLAAPQPYLPNSQVIFMQPNVVTASVEPLMKRPRLDDPDTFVVSEKVATFLPHAETSIEVDEKDANAADSAETAIPLSMTEAEFARSLHDPNITLQVLIPLDSTNKAWNFNGQTLNLTVNVMTKVKAIKEKLQSQLGGMPINKMQLRNATIGFLKDTATLAYCNIGHSNCYIELVPKTRGGRK